jgi:serine/threonine protein phosphatase PrpC
VRFNVGSLSTAKDGARTNEDTVLVREAAGLFGVFDGIGGGGDGDVASSVAAQAVTSFYTGESDEVAADSSQASDRARRALVEAGRALARRAAQAPPVSADMGTTATIGCVYGDRDGLGVAYAHVGDSGLLIYRRDGDKLTFLTQNEAQGNVLDNALTAREEVLRGVRQYGSVTLQPGDRLVFFSDGISGDTPDQRLSHEEYRQAIVGVSPQQAARALSEVSRKFDDTSVVVVDPLVDEGNKKQAVSSKKQARDVTRNCKERPCTGNKKQAVRSKKQVKKCKAALSFWPPSLNPLSRDGFETDPEINLPAGRQVQDDSFFVTPLCHSGHRSGIH